MPVVRHDVSKGPRNRLWRYAAADNGVRVDVRLIVEIDEPVRESLSEHDPNQGDERNSEAGKFPPTARAIGHG